MFYTLILQTLIGNIPSAVQLAESAIHERAAARAAAAAAQVFRTMTEADGRSLIIQ